MKYSEKTEYQKKAIRRSTQAYKRRNPHKNRAHKRVYDAIKSGRLVRPTSCEICKEHGLIHAHHDDYSKPLDVKFICRSCHVQLHHGVKHV